ncbi:MAG TPA: N-acetylmuramoyl-L-alanine amidase [Roseiflexaceae bacterium]|nr:N-acetylmuramoyl-L-alanine amidase [Roseiflexaceae bacterium]
MTPATDKSLDPADAAGYLSPVVTAPRPFSHLLVRLSAVLPPGSDIVLHIRSAIDAGQWSAWQPIAFDDDMWQPEDGDGVRWSEIVGVGHAARLWQVRATFQPDAGGVMPQLQNLTGHTVDARGPEAEPDTPPDKAGRPTIISRSAWGCPDGQGSRATPRYRQVTHLVVHHTTGSNTLANGETWAARVRAIWSYHAITRGWGDIGYNFLIAPTGTIFEGRAGGDDAVGFHDTANYGSTGVSILGTYTSVAPSAAAQSALVSVLAWKAGQKGINPHGSGFYYGCSISSYCAPFNDGSRVPTISGHRQVTPGHTTCPGNAFAALLPNIRDRVKNAIGSSGGSNASIELLNVRYNTTWLAAGELLRVQFTVRNNGTTTLRGQGPQVAIDGGGWPLADNDGYVYDQDECFAGDQVGSYTAYPKEDGSFRVVLGPTGWDAEHAGSAAGPTSDYPWRWGLNADLAPGAQQTIVGYVRFRRAGSYTLRAGIVEEYVKYHTQDAATTSLVVGAERGAPEAAYYDERLVPLARIYRTSPLPRNMLERPDAAASFVRTELLGSFSWSGNDRSWGNEGLQGHNGPLLVDQTRVFYAPRAGSYGFRLFGSGYGWLWINGQLVAAGGSGGTSTRETTGAITLAAGVYVLAYRSYAPLGSGAIGYGVRAPGATVFSPPSDGLGGGVARFGTIFGDTITPVLVADDRGGSGVARIRWSWDGVQWQEQSGGLLQIARLQAGDYTIFYQAVDAAGNAGPTAQISFKVAPGYTPRRTFVPWVS